MLAALSACGARVRVAGARRRIRALSEAQRRRARLARAGRRATTPTASYTRRRRKRFRERDDRGAMGRCADARRARRSARVQRRDVRSARSRRRHARTRPRATSWSSSSAATFAKRGRRHRDGDARARGRRQVAGGRLLDALMRRRRPGAPACDETAALSKFACPACGGEAIWNPGQAEARLSVLRHRIARPSSTTATGGIVEHDLVAALRGIADDARGWKADKRQVKCQSCNAISVFDPDAAGAELRVLRLGAARPVRGDQARVPARERAAVRGQRGKRARSHPAVVRQAVARAQCAQAPRADRHGEGHLPAVLDVRRAGRRAVDRGGRPLLLHDRDLHRGRADAHAAGAARALGAGGRAPVAFLRRRSRVRVGRRAPGAAARHRAVSDADAEALRRGLRRRLGRRALPDRPRRRRAARARGDGRQGRRRCARSRFPATRIAISSCTRLFAADVQAHPRAGVAHDATPTARARSSACRTA